MKVTEMFLSSCLIETTAEY